MARVSLPHDFTPREYQQEYMDWFDHGGRFRIDVWHRRAGKDLVALHQTAKMAHQKIGMYWHCLPTYSQARKAVWNNFNQTTGVRLLRSIFPKEIVKHPDEFRPQAEMLIELKCGSMIQLIGSDSIDNVVGAGPRHVTFSEYALCRPNSFDLVRPMIRQNGGTASFITTPRGKNHAWEQFEKAKTAKGWARSLWDVHRTNLLYPAAEDSSILIDAEAMMREEEAAGMQPELIRQEYLCDWEAALVGSVYGDLMEAISKEGSIYEFSDTQDFVFVTFDLGMNDSTALWFWNVKDGGVDIVAHYENHGKTLEHYFDELETICKLHNWQCRKIFLPHDAKATSLQTGMSTQELFWGRFGHGVVEIVPMLPVIQGIQAARWLLKRKVRFHSRCAKKQGLEALKQYHYEFDDKRRTYTNRPEHDWSSHTADSFRYLAVTVKAGKMISERLVEDSRPKIYGPPAVLTVTPIGGVLYAGTKPDHSDGLHLTGLFEDQDNASKSGGIERIP